MVFLAFELLSVPGSLPPCKKYGSALSGNESGCKCRKLCEQADRGGGGMVGCLEGEEKSMRVRDCPDFLVIRHNKVSMLFTVHALITQVSDSVKL